MGGPRTEAKKRERDRLRYGRDTLRERLVALTGRLSIRFGGPEYVRPPSPLPGLRACVFERVARAEGGRPVATSATTCQLSLSDDEIVAKVVQESTAKLRAMLESPKTTPRLGAAIEHSIGKQMPEAHDA